MHLANTYIQKSHLFLFPLIGLSTTDKFKPINTYVEYKEEIKKEDCCIVCQYERVYSDDYYAYRSDTLESNPFFLKKITTLNHDLIIFNLIDYHHDIKMFLLGKYSKFSTEAKNKILDFYSHSDHAQVLIHSHMEPKEFHQYYADYFNVSKELIEQNHETISAPDLIKEKLG